MNLYAGIGSRETPDIFLTMMEEYAALLYKKLEYILRSGGAKGADSAFEKGCDSVQGTKEIFRAQDATSEAIELASKYHPAWDRCNDYAKALHGRNMLIILGKDLNTPVDFILCWTPGGKAVGGTGQALRVAIDYEIPVYNLYNKADLKLFKQILWESV